LIIKCEYDGKSWAYDDDDLTVLQGIAIEERIKGTLMDYDDGLSSGRSDCYQALGWLVFHAASPDVPITGVDFPLVKLSSAWMEARLAAIGEARAAVEAAEAEAAEAAKPAPPDPTGAPGSGQQPGNTSGPSPRSSAISQPTSTDSASASSTT
jgi:hypothetical protein